MPSGGARKGAGRPKGQGKYNEPTKAVRLPVSVINALNSGKGFSQSLPLYLSKVSAGAPSPAENDMAEQLNLNDYLVKHPASTFLVKANGHSMINAGIDENDILVVDRSLAATVGKVVIAAIDGQLTVKRLKKSNEGRMILAAENPAYEAIEILEQNEITILGVVTSVIHKL